jgi:hypothetical protein
MRTLNLIEIIWSHHTQEATVIYMVHLLLL